MTRLSFHGGAGMVTGSKYLVEHAGRAVLVDCGLFQGHKELRERNWRGPDFEPADVDAVLLTHAHLDHCGYLPRLVRDGFRGPVFATPATADIADVILRDAAKIQEEDAAYANRRGYSKHRPALPLFTGDDAERALGQFEVVDFDVWSAPAPGLRARFVPAGHILGSGFVELEVARGDSPPLRIVFSGDVGRTDAPLVGDPSPPPACDVLVIESTYGDRSHPRTSIEAQLTELLEAVHASRGTLLFPSFAVGRAQQLLVLLERAMAARPELRVPVHLDSPMAVDTTVIYGRYPEEDGLEELRLHSGNRSFFGAGSYLHRTVEDSRRLNGLTGPRAIIASSGMLTGGRVLHHLRRLAPGADNVVVLPGYQAPGTRGWRLERGEESVRVHGEEVPVRCRVAKVTGLSAHADREQLLAWAGRIAAPARTFVTHGEPDAAAALARALESELGHACEVPGLGDGFDL